MRATEKERKTGAAWGEEGRERRVPTWVFTRWGKERFANTRHEGVSCLPRGLRVGRVRRDTRRSMTISHLHRLPERRSGVRLGRHRSRSSFSSRPLLPRGKKLGTTKNERRFVVCVRRTPQMYLGYADLRSKRWCQLRARCVDCTPMR